jgi:hypothetical protein
MMKGIHPEYLLGKKGSHYETVINSLAALGKDTSDEYEKCSLEEKKLLLRETQYIDESRKIQFFEGTKRELDSDSVKIKNILEIQKAHQLGRFKVYSVGKNFFDAVRGLKRELDYKYIGADGDVLFIKAPEVTMNGTVYNGCYVRCMDYGVMLMFTPKGHYTIQGCKTFFTFSADQRLRLEEEYGFQYKNLDLDPETDGTQTFADFTTEDSADFANWMNGIVNTAVYVNSQDPEIEELRPLRLYDRKQLSQIENTKRENLCTLPVRLVHWGYYRRYHVGSTTVSGHFRWQPCGVGLKDVKLVWIEDHVRNYNQLEQAAAVQ